MDFCWFSASEQHERYDARVLTQSGLKLLRILGLGCIGYIYIYIDIDIDIYI